LFAGGRRIVAIVTRRRRLSLPTDRPHLSTAQLTARAASARAVVASSDPFWPAQLAALAALLLYLTLPHKVTLGPAWVLPSVEGLLLAGLVITAPSRHRPYSPRRRTFALGLIGLVTAVNFVSLGLLTHFLLRGGKANGHALILAGVVIWLTNILVFALWYWEIDRGGPITRVLDREAAADFLFIQMPDPWVGNGEWLPGFVDYLYLSVTNQTALSPTDTMPLTHRAKLFMTAQALASLVTIGLVISRAVGILG
jgi:hypothetical protein